MNAAESEAEAAESGEDVASEAAADEQASSDDDRPPIEDGQKADLDDIRAEVAEASTPPDSPEEEGEASDQQKSAGEQPEPAENSQNDPQTTGDTVGDFYVDTLVSTSNMVIDRHGRPGEDEIDGAMLRQMGVDDAIDELLSENGQPDMPPEQQVLLGTTVFAVTMLATKTTVFDQALENSDFDLLDL